MAERSSLTKRTTLRSSPSVRDEARALFRNAILDAAEEVFASKGFHGARVQDIARRARLAVGTIYNHFGQKEDVLLALLDLRMQEMVEVISHSPDDPTKFEDKLVARIERFFAYRSRHDAFFSFAIDHGLLGDATGAAKQILGGRTLAFVGRVAGALGELVDEGIAASALAPIDRDLMAAFLKGALRSGSRWLVDQNGAASTTETARAIADLFLYGASPRPAVQRKAARRV